MPRYGVGRTKDVGIWWKWKIDPYQRRCRAGLCAGRPRPARQPLHRLHLRRLGRDSPENPMRALVPFAKAYSGLTDAEMRAGRCDHSQDHAWKVRPGAQRQADAACSSSASKASRAAGATRAASRCAFRACCAGATTSRSPRPIRYRRWRRCSRTGPENCRAIDVTRWRQATRVRSDGWRCATGSLFSFQRRVWKAIVAKPFRAPACKHGGGQDARCLAGGIGAIRAARSGKGETERFARCRRFP